MFVRKDSRIFGNLLFLRGAFAEIRGAFAEIRSIFVRHRGG
jgi:hypothetical protein